MDEELKKLLAQNLAKSEEVYEISKRVKRYLLIAQILSILKLIIIVVPIILAIIYLPPFFREALGEYQNLLNSTGLKLPFSL